MIFKEITLYHLTDSGHTITDKPMTLNAMREQFGNLRKLELQGMRVIKSGKRIYERQTEHSLCKHDYVPRRN